MKARITKRYEWLISVIQSNRFSIGAEIGCAQGFTTGRVLRQCPSLKTLYAVDLWEKVPDDSVRDDNYDNWDFNKVWNQFKQNTRISQHKLQILKGITWEMSEQVKDNSLDFVFIDAGHTYECVKKDILAWAPKLKKNGILCGHDINMEGVHKAVFELCSSFNSTGIDHVWECRKEDTQCL
jgi:hypothetical protein